MQVRILHGALMTDKMQQLLDRFQGNTFEEMHRDLATHLGVSYESVKAIAPGWVPVVKFAKGPHYKGWWAVPERDDCGNVIGLGLRSQSDVKVMYPGSKHGLIYAVNPEHRLGDRGYSPGASNWVRTMDAGLLCPVCGKPDGCLLSSENPTDPRAVVCRVKQTDRPQNFGWLHVLKSEGQLGNRGPLASSELPVICVEGFSDTASAIDIGFQAVGRPSDQAGMNLLVSLLRGRKVWIIGENDKKPDGREPGKEGMIAAFQNLTKVATCRMLMPPSHVKDLRDWKKKDGITQADLIAYMEQHGKAEDDRLAILDDRPTTIGIAFLDDFCRQTGRYLVRQWKGSWYRYGDGAYQELDEASFIQPMYQWAKTQLLTTEKPNGEGQIKPLKMTSHMVVDLKQAIMSETLLPLASLPCWVNGTQGPDPKSLIVFNNGVLDVEAYLRGDVDCLLPHTPDLFSTVALPFPFDPTAQCPFLEAFMESSLGDEPNKVSLLREWTGYCMTSDTRHQKMMYLRGLPGSGKGTYLRMLHNLVGDGNCASTSFADLAGQFGLKPLLGKQICTIADARSPGGGEQMRGLEVLLNLSGEDKVQVNRKFKDQMDDVRLIARITIASNSFIEIPDYEGAMARRLLLLEWKKSFVDKPDLDLDRKLKDELPGIALWALEGLRSLRRNGRFTVPASSIEAMAEWRTANSPLASFLDECCEKAGEVDKARLWEVWEAWTLERGIKPMSMSRFYERVRGAYPTIQAIAGERAGHPISIFSGLRLMNWADRRY